MHIDEVIFCQHTCFIEHPLIDKCSKITVIKIVTGKFGFLTE